MISKEKCLDLIDDVKCTIGCEYVHASILSEIYEYLEEIEKFINQSASTPTLSECIKEWEEKGWKVTKFSQSLKIENFYKDIIINFAEWDKSILIANKNFVLARDIPFDLIPLIHKTLKALEVEDE